MFEGGSKPTKYEGIETIGVVYFFPSEIVTVSWTWEDDCGINQIYNLNNFYSSQNHE